MEEHEDYVAALRAAEADSRPRAAGRWTWTFPRLIPAFAALAVGILAVAIWVRGPHSGSLPAAAVVLNASRGPAAEALAPAGSPLDLRPDLSGLPAASSYKLELVDELGKRIWQGAHPGPAAPPLRPGVYFVRIYSTEGRLYREYALRAAAR